MRNNSVSFNRDTESRSDESSGRQGKKNIPEENKVDKNLQEKNNSETPIYPWRTDSDFKCSNSGPSSDCMIHKCTDQPFFGWLLKPDESFDITVTDLNPEEEIKYDILPNTTETLLLRHSIFRSIGSTHMNFELFDVLNTTKPDHTVLYSEEHDYDCKRKNELLEFSNPKNLYRTQPRFPIQIVYFENKYKKILRNSCTQQHSTGSFSEKKNFSKIIRSHSCHTSNREHTSLTSNQSSCDDDSSTFTTTSSAPVNASPHMASPRLKSCVSERISSNRTVSDDAVNTNRVDESCQPSESRICCQRMVPLQMSPKVCPAATKFLSQELEHERRILEQAKRKIEDEKHRLQDEKRKFEHQTEILKMPLCGPNNCSNSPGEKYAHPKYYCNDKTCPEIMKYLRNEAVIRKFCYENQRPQAQVFGNSLANEGTTMNICTDDSCPILNDSQGNIHTVTENMTINLNSVKKNQHPSISSHDICRSVKCGLSNSLIMNIPKIVVPDQKKTSLLQRKGNTCCVLDNNRSIIQRKTIAHNNVTDKIKPINVNDNPVTIYKIITPKVDITIENDDITYDPATVSENTSITLDPLRIPPSNCNSRVCCGESKTTTQLEKSPKMYDDNSINSEYQNVKSKSAQNADKKLTQNLTNMNTSTTTNNPPRAVPRVPQDDESIKSLKFKNINENYTTSGTATPPYRRKLQYKEINKNTEPAKSSTNKTVTENSGNTFQKNQSDIPKTKRVSVQKTAQLNSNGSDVRRNFLDKCTSTSSLDQLLGHYYPRSESISEVLRCPRINVNNNINSSAITSEIRKSDYLTTRTSTNCNEIFKRETTVTALPSCCKEVMRGPEEFRHSDIKVPNNSVNEICEAKCLKKNGPSSTEHKSKKKQPQKSIAMSGNNLDYKLSISLRPVDEAHHVKKENCTSVTDIARLRITLKPDPAPIGRVHSSACCTDLTYVMKRKTNGQTALKAPCLKETSEVEVYTCVSKASVESMRSGDEEDMVVLMDTSVDATKPPAEEPKVKLFGRPRNRAHSCLQTIITPVKKINISTNVDNKMEAVNADTSVSNLRPARTIKSTCTPTSLSRDTSETSQLSQRSSCCIVKIVPRKQKQKLKPEKQDAAMLIHLIESLKSIVAAHNEKKENREKKTCSIDKDKDKDVEIKIYRPSRVRQKPFRSTSATSCSCVRMSDVSSDSLACCVKIKTVSNTTSDDGITIETMQSSSTNKSKKTKSSSNSSDAWTTTHRRGRYYLLSKSKSSGSKNNTAYGAKAHDSVSWNRYSCNRTEKKLIEKMPCSTTKSSSTSKKCPCRSKSALKHHRSFQKHQNGKEK